MQVQDIDRLRLQLCSILQLIFVIFQVYLLLCVMKTQMWNSFYNLIIMCIDKGMCNEGMQLTEGNICQASNCVHTVWATDDISVMRKVGRGWIERMG